MSEEQRYLLQFLLFQRLIFSQMWWLMPLFMAQVEELCEFKAGLVYMERFRVASYLCVCVVVH